MKQRSLWKLGWISLGDLGLLVVLAVMGYALRETEIARDAGVGYLLYNHIVPPLPLASMEEIFLDGVAGTWSGPVSVGRDGTLVRLPADSEAIELDELL